MENGTNEISRRSFLMNSTAAGAATAFTIIRPELVRGAGNEKLKAGLIGCGGRGTEAAQQFLHGNENVELVAVGDIFEDHLEKSLGEIRDSKYTGVAEKVKVDPDHHFVGFGEPRRSKAMAEGDRSGVLYRRAVVPFARQVLAVLFQDGAKGIRLLLLQGQQSAIVGESFREPHVAVALPQHRIPPPLVCGLVRLHQFAKQQLLVGG